LLLGVKVGINKDSLDSSSLGVEVGINKDSFKDGSWVGVKVGTNQGSLDGFEDGSWLGVKVGTDDSIRSCIAHIGRCLRRKYADWHARQRTFWGIYLPR
jgi:hypothetical protein